MNDTGFITATLKLIKAQTGLKLQLCDHFTGVKNLAGEDYFNVTLKESISESNEFTALERFAKKYKLIRVEPNGWKRVAIIKSQ